MQQDSDRPTPIPWQTRVHRTWRGRCPRCGEGALFLARFRLRPSCPHCGLTYRRESGAMTGQMYLSAVVTEILAAVLTLSIFFFTDWGSGLSMAVGLPIVIGFAYWSLPRFMALWVAVEFLTDQVNREAWTRDDDPGTGKPAG